MWADFFLFVSEVLSRWQGLVTGGIAVAILEIIERCTRWKLSRRYYFIIFVVLFLPISSFLAWRDQYRAANLPFRTGWTVVQDAPEGYMSISVEVLSSEQLQPVHLEVVTEPNPQNIVEAVDLSINNEAVVGPTWSIADGKLDIRFTGPSLDIYRPLRINMKVQSKLQVLGVRALRY